LRSNSNVPEILAHARRQYDRYCLPNAAV